MNFRYRGPKRPSARAVRNQLAFMSGSAKQESAPRPTQAPKKARPKQCEI